MSKKYFTKTLITAVFLILLSIVVFWFGSGKLFTEDYYPAAVIACPLLFIISAVWLILDIREYLSKKPYAEISSQGIQMFNGVYKEIGVVPCAKLPTAGRWLPLTLERGGGCIFM